MPESATIGSLVTPVIVILLIVIVLCLIASCIKIVPQAQAYIVERLGGYQATWGVGIHFKLPIIDKVARKVLLKEQVMDFPPQPVITEDNVTMQIDTVVFFQITDPKLFTYGVENPIMAIENLTATTLRNIIGDLELDQTLTSRETINTQMRSSLDIATDPWGIKVNRVELKNIIPPREIQDSMEKQMKAERERRESILRAEGEKKSTVLVAEGKKESAILEAQAEKEAAILRADHKKGDANGDNLQILFYIPHGGRSRPHQTAHRINRCQDHHHAGDTHRGAGPEAERTGMLCIICPSLPQHTGNQRRTADAEEHSHCHKKKKRRRRQRNSRHLQRILRLSNKKCIRKVIHQYHDHTYHRGNDIDKYGFGYWCILKNLNRLILFCTHFPAPPVLLSHSRPS